MKALDTTKNHPLVSSETSHSPVIWQDMENVLSEFKLSPLLETDELSLKSRQFEGAFTPQNTVTDGQVTVSVAGVQAQYQEYNVVIKPQALLSDADTHPHPSSSSKAIEIKDILSNSIATANQNELIDFIETAKEIAEEGGKAEVIDRDVHIENGLIKLSTQYSHQGSEVKDELFNENFQVFKRQMLGDEQLSKDIIETLNDRMLDQYPLIKHEQSCGTHSHEGVAPLAEAILSRTYTSNSDATQAMLGEAIQTYASISPYTQEMIKVIGTASVLGEQAPFATHKSHHTVDGVIYHVSRESDGIKFVHCQNAQELSAHTSHVDNAEIGGYYSAEYNVVTFSGAALENDFAPHFIHEASHAAFNLLFQNESKPYASEEEHMYLRAELDTLKGVGIKLGMKTAELDSAETTEEIIDLLKANALLLEINKGQAEKGALYALNLNEHDLKIMSEFSNLVHDYQKEQISQELIVRIPQLLADDVPEPVMKDYFQPMMHYWDQAVTPKAIAFLETHHEAQPMISEPQHLSMLLPEVTPEVVL